MAKILNIGKIIVGLDGKAVIDEEKTAITVRILLLQYVTRYTTEDSEDIVRTRILAEEIFREKNDLELEEAPFDLLHLKVIRPPMNPAVIYGQLLDVFDEAKPVKKKTPREK